MAINGANFITRQPLANLSVRYMNDKTAYIWDKLFPVKNVPKRTASFYVIGKEGFSNDSTIAPSGAEARSGDFSVSTKTLTLNEYAWKGIVLGRDERDMDAPVADLTQMQAQLNADKLMLDIEINAATKATTAANWPSGQVTTLASGSTWMDGAGDPLEDVRNGRQTAFEASFKYPNVGFTNQKTVDYLRIHPALREYFKYTQPGKASLQMLASLFDLDAIYVSNVMKNTANEGATFSGSQVWTDKFVLAYVDPNPGLATMTFGLTFMAEEFWTKSYEAPELGRNKGAHWIESGWEWTQEFIARDSSEKPLAGFLIDNVY